MKDFVSEENLSKLVVERCVAKLISQDGGTEKPFDFVGKVCSLGASNLVDSDTLEVDGLPGMDIERVFVGTEPDDVFDEVKRTVKVEFVGVGFVCTIYESVNV